MKKITLARKLNTRFERFGNFTKGYPWYQLPSWQKRKTAISERVGRNVERAIKNKEAKIKQK